MNDSLLKSRIQECREIRAARRKEAYESVSATHGRDVRHELELLYDDYGEEIYLWLAGLWDARTGGFYYSNSARDNEGFLPDIESTVQALRLTEATGLFPSSRGGWKEFLPEEMKKGLLSFATGLQSGKDGFFYHPQWGENIGLERKGRDLGWATDLIQNLGARPLYDTPNGITGSLGAPETALKGSVTESATAASPDYLRTLADFKDFLDSLDFSLPYYIGNKLNALKCQISAAGKDYTDFFIKYINERQNPETGLWGDGVSYVTVNGFFKIASTASQLGYRIEYPLEALRSVMQMSLTPTLSEDSGHVCTTYNCWVAMALIMKNLRVQADGQMYGRLRAELLETAPELLRITRSKIKVFRKPDGGFSFFPGHPAHINQGALISVENVPESDVNATCILTNGLAREIGSVLGINNLGMFEQEDGRLLLELFDERK